MISPYAHALTAVFAISFLIGAKENILSYVTSFLILFHIHSIFSHVFYCLQKRENFIKIHKTMKKWA